MALLEFLTQRWLVVSLAIVGALMVLAAGLIAARQPVLANTVNRAGYALTMASIALFVVAGFMVGR